MISFEAPREPMTPGQAGPPEPHTPFDVEIRRRDDRAIVAPTGELDLATVDRLVASIDGLVDARFATIVLDLRGLTFMDSTGLCLILEQSRRPGVAMHVIDGVDATARLFDICHVRDLLSFIDPDEA
jgi:anti-anti-sigma factor